MGMAAYPCAGGGGAGAAFRLALHGDGGGLAMVSLLHGDCLELLPSVADGSVSMVFADLPYGVTHNRWDTPIDLAALWAQLLRVGKRNAAFVFTATQPFATALINSQSELLKYDMVWVKNQAAGFLNANKMPLRGHEGVWVFFHGRATYNPQKTPGKPYSRKNTGKSLSANYGGAQPQAGIRHYDGSRHPTTVLYFPLDARKDMVHPTQKPVALLEWLIRTYSNPGDLILDPTAGSGTTGVACLNTGRSFIGMEKDATYFATAQRRLAEAQPPLPGAA